MENLMVSVKQTVNWRLNVMIITVKEIIFSLINKEEYNVCD